MSRLRSWIRRLYAREGFRGPVVTLLSGTAVTLVISYLAVPILTRLFTPEEFGISDYFVTMMSVLITFASLRYEDAVMLPREDAEAGAIIWLAGILTVGTSLLVAVCAFWTGPITGFLRVESVSPWFWMLAPTLLLMRTARLSEVWLSRKKAFRLISGGEVANKVTMVSTRLGAGAATQLGAGGLIGGFFAAHVVSAAYHAVVLLRRAPSLLNVHVSASRIRAAAMRYRRFPLYATPAALLNAIVARLPVLLLPLYFDLSTVGLFGRAYVALAVPLSLVGSAVSQVFFVHAAEALRTHRLRSLTKSVHARLVMIGMFPTVLLILNGPDLFAFVFGPTWRIAGVYEQLLAVWFFASAVASPLTRLFDVLERQRTELIISIASCLALTLAVVAGGRSGSVLLTLALLAAAGAAVRILHIGTMLRIAGVGLGEAVQPYVRYLLLSLALALPVFFTREVLPLWATAAVAAFFGACYLAIVAWREKLLPPSPSE